MKDDIFSECHSKNIPPLQEQQIFWFYSFHCRGTDIYKNKTLLWLYCRWAYAKLFKQKEEKVVHMDLTRSDWVERWWCWFFFGGGGTNQKSYNLLKFLRLRRVNFFSFPVSHSLGLCITRADKFCNFNLIKSTQLCLIYMKVNI